MSYQIQYNDFPTFLRKHFPYKVQKISLNAGFTCPNRDGTKGWGGCTYCNNQTFNPDYCRTEKSIATQLEEGKCFFAHKYPEMKYLAYFQAYTNTYAELEGLKRKYEEALQVDGVVGLVIGTRPACSPCLCRIGISCWTKTSCPCRSLCRSGRRSRWRRSGRQARHSSRCSPLSEDRRRRLSLAAAECQSYL